GMASTYRIGPTSWRARSDPARRLPVPRDSPAPVRRPEVGGALCAGDSVAGGNAMSSQDKVVLITGASRGLGREVARQFARRGARLVITARGAEDLERAVDELGQLTDVVAAPGNVADAAHAGRLVRLGIE